MSRPTFTEPWYALTRFSETVVNTREGEPVFITNIQENFRVYAQDYLGDNSLTLHFSDLDMATPLLGYVNTPMSCYYWARKPTRHYKYGINDKNTCGIFNGGINASSIAIRTSSHLKTLENDYPDYLLSAENVLGGAEMSAFSRDFSFARSPEKGKLFVYYRSIPVGDVRVNTDGGVVSLGLKPHYRYLAELFERDCYGK